MVADFVRYYTRTPIFHGCWFHEILYQITISHGYRFRDILHQNLKSVWLQISWDITQEPQYLRVADFMRYCTRTTISHGCRFHDIIHHNHNISWLTIAWDIAPKPQYLMVADFVRYYTSTQYLMFHISLELRCLIVLDFMRHFIRITISHDCRFHEILYQNHYIS